MPAAAVRTREMSTKMKDNLTNRRPAIMSQTPRDAAAGTDHDLEDKGG
jgi:hypothetical protein